MDVMDVSPAIEALNPEQATAVLSEAPYLCVLAGAGSGKTRVLVHRMVHLIQQHGLSPNRLMAVTFTNKAANEMRHRIQQELGYQVNDLWVGTFHGLAYRILRASHEAAHLSADFQIIDSDDQLRLIKRICKSLAIDEDDHPPRQVQGRINRWKDEGKRPSQINQTSFADAALYADLYQRYQNECDHLNLVDFAELLLRVYELFRDQPEVLEPYQRRFNHILVDEFQDTNWIQYQWLKLLAGSQNAITIVGDDDQSIYGWRGARIENIHQFQKDYPGTEMVRLEQNYRSSATILAAANAVISQNQSRLGKRLWTEGADGEPIALYSAFNEVDEARFAVERIRKWLESGQRSLDDVAILYRSNAQSRILEQALRQAAVPYKIYGGQRFFDRAEIKDVLAYMRLVQNVRDDAAFERVVNFPPRGLGEKTLGQIRSIAQAENLSMFEAGQSWLAFQGSTRAATALRGLFDLFEDLVQSLHDMSLGDLTKRVLEDTGLLLYVKSQPGEKSYSRVENMQEMITATEQYAEAHAESLNLDDTPMAARLLPTFLAEVSLDNGDRDADKMPGVSMMTLHASKGLEFPFVIMTGMEEGLFPHARSAQTPEQLEEERRLAYVGITRAMQQLCLTYAEKRSFAGTGGLNTPSRFITEIPKPLIKPVNISLQLMDTAKASEAVDLPFKIGARIMHGRFGEGTIMAYEGQGAQLRAQVQFDSVGMKWLVLSYAKLTPLTK